jgi:hypothetical protein
MVDWIFSLSIGVLAVSLAARLEPEARDAEVDIEVEVDAETELVCIAGTKESEISPAPPPPLPLPTSSTLNLPLKPESVSSINPLTSSVPALVSRISSKSLNAAQESASRTSVKRSFNKSR